METYVKEKEIALGRFLFFKGTVSRDWFGFC
jgi:hypothetical protein